MNTNTQKKRLIRVDNDANREQKRFKWGRAERCVCGFLKIYFYDF